MGDSCQCGWLLSEKGNCCNPNHDGVMLRQAAEAALEFLESGYDYPAPQVVIDLRKALGRA